MNTSKKYFAQTMDDIIFENRNKEYGAYRLRKDNDKNITKGLAFVLFVVTALSIYSITKKIPVQEITEIITVSPQKINELIFPEKKIELPQHSEPPKPIEKSNTQDIREFVAVIDSAASDKQVASNDDLKDKTIGVKTDSTGTSVITNPFADNNGTGNNGTGTSEVGKTKTEFLLFAEVMPSFDNMDRWLSKNIKYPRQAVDLNIQGKVYIEFIVNADGSISDAIVAKGIGFGCDEEALNAIKKMPKWKPGMQQGNPVRVKVTKPVEFRIN